MKLILRPVILLTLMVSVTIAYSQTASVAVDKESKLWVGLNGGALWQSSDIKSAFGTGYGLTFDYYFIRNNTSIFGLGFRGQFLKGTTYGLGVTKDFDIQNNPALNGTGGNPDYAALSPGKNYVFQNYSTEIADLSGNLIVTLNRLRAVSNLNVYVFGGLGGTGYTAKTNQRDASGNLYDYDVINTTGGNASIKKDLRNLLDDTYETYGEKGDKVSRTLNATVGAGIGYQISNRIQIGIEHKVGFTGTDLLDGNKWSTGNTRNDIYHYTTAGITFGLGKLSSGNRTASSSSNQSVTRIPPPIIRMNDPASSPTVAENCKAAFTFVVEHVTGKQNVTVTMNGSPIDFDFFGDAVSLSDYDFKETADFVVRVRNTSGSAEASVKFVCQPKPAVEMITICHRSRTSIQTISIPVTEWETHAAHGDIRGACPELPAPVVTITSPANSPVTLENCVANITASVDNINSKQNITVTLNGSPIAFDFQRNTVTVSSATFTGTAQVVIRARNSSGTHEKSVSFICNPPVDLITICHKIPGGTTQTINIPANEWTTHANHGDSRGACPVIPAPVITITSPATSPTTVETCTAAITARVENVSDRQNITVTQNGSPINFNFSNGTITLSNIAFTGTADFVIKATNASGEFEETTTFICKPVEQITICHKVVGSAPQSINIPITAWATHAAHGDTRGACPSCEPPAVSITGPGNNESTQQAAFTINATVSNVLQSQIKVEVNGKAVPFTLVNRTVTASAIATDGLNSVRVTVTNDCGSESDNVTLNYAPCVAPSVALSTPVHNSIVKESEVSITANTSNVDQSQVTVKLNGINVPFTLSNNQLIAQARLESGPNVIEVRAANACGTQTRSANITYNPCLIPTVKIASPSGSSNVAQANIAFSAAVANVAQNQVSLKLNNVDVPFTFSNNVVSASLTAIEGTNSIQISVANDCGNNSERATVTYTAPVVAPPCLAPTSSIASPANNISLTQSAFTITATVTNVNSDQTVVKLNNAFVPFTLSGNTVTAQLNAAAGANNIEVTATNDCGNQSAKVVVNYTPCVAPTLSINSPTDKSTIKESSVTINASVTNVLKNQVAVKLNGVDVPFTLTNNIVTTQLTTTIGSNKVEITATNECGNKISSLDINYLPPPSVTISAPGNSPVTTEDCIAAITASIENVSDKQSISVTQEGNPTDFNFANNQVTVSNLSFTGTANFVVKATNASGSDEKSVSFICKPKEKEITICHYPPGNRNNPQAITIPESAWAAHQAHGDVQGDCPVIPAPTVTIASPKNSPVTTEDCIAAITASIENVSDKQSISVTQDGNPIDFNFANNQVTVSNLSFTGTANFVVKATNASGSAEQSVSFICKPKEKEITICHYPPGNRNNPQAITIPESAWAAHQAHGDVQGDCPVIPAPVVTISAPGGSPVTTEDCIAAITASIENVSDKQSISVTQDGNPIDFNFANNQVTVSNLSFTGTANFLVKATNASGSAEQSVSFICKPKEKEITICHYPPGNRNNPQAITIPESAWAAHQAHGDVQGDCPVIPAPTVTIASPKNSPVTTEDCIAAITASIENVSDKQSISVTQDGNAIDFNFSNNQVSVSNLSFTGTVNFVVKATNASGSDVKSVSFICKPKEKEITICHYPPGNRNNPQAITIPESAWAAHQAHGDVQGDCPVIPAPTVTIASPKNSPVTTEDCIAAITASIENVSDKQSISVTQDGNAIDFNFSNNQVSVSNLGFTGTANFVVKASNASGSAEQSVSFICKPKEKEITICHYPPGNRNNPQAITIPESAWAAHQAHGDVQGDCPVIPQPELNINSPESTSVTVSDCKVNVQASAKNVDDKNDIKVTLNGKPVAFDYSDGTIQISDVAFTDNATVVITASNKSGSATRSVEYKCEVKEEKPENNNDDNKPEKEEEKITICHHPPGNKDNPQTITITASAWPAHEKHGDTMGPCKEN